MSASSDWSRDESRYVDGELGADEARRLEAQLEQDPRVAERLDAWQDAMALWRDDASRLSTSFDAAGTTAAVLANIHGQDAGADTSLAALRRYAAAAVLLLGLGTAGAAWLGPDPGPAPVLSGSGALRLLEAGQLDHYGRLELTSFPQPAATRSGTER